MSLSAIPRTLRASVAERDSGQCRYCGLSQTGQAAAFHVNHVIPKSKGGLTSLENLVLQCPHCSLHKSNKVDGVDRETHSTAPLFHPLRQNWREHFAVVADGTCVGLTAVGRVTVAELRMNDPLPKTARALQSLLGLNRL